MRIRIEEYRGYLIQVRFNGLAEIVRPDGSVLREWFHNIKAARKAARDDVQEAGRLGLFWTDYPIRELDPNWNDYHFKAPVRVCQLVSYDQDKYVTIKTGGVIAEVKGGHVYDKPQRSLTIMLPSQRMQSVYKKLPETE